MAGTAPITLPAGTFHVSNVTEGLMQKGMKSDDLGYLYRRSLDLRYCEAKYGGIFYGAITEQPEMHFPEIGSVITTPFILWAGLHMIFFWRHDSSLLHVLSALFVVNGGSSFLAHYTGIMAWHSVDAKSMLLAVWLGCGVLLSELIGNVFRRLRLNGAVAVRTGITPLSWLIPVIVYFWLTETNGTLPDEREYGHRIGAAGTAVPLFVCVVIGFIHVLAGWGRTEAISESAYRLVRRRFLGGVLIAAVGALAWALTENLCDRPDTVGRVFRWFPGHALWHATVAYGLTMALLFACGLRADSFRTRVYIRTDNWYFTLLPRLNFDAARGIVTPLEEQTPEPTRARDTAHAPSGPPEASWLLRGLSFFRSSAELVGESSAHAKRPLKQMSSAPRSALSKSRPHKQSNLGTNGVRNQVV